MTQSGFYFYDIGAEEVQIFYCKQADLFLSPFPYHSG